MTITESKSFHGTVKKKTNDWVDLHNLYTIKEIVKLFFILTIYYLLIIKFMDAVTFIYNILLQSGLKWLMNEHV